MPGFFRNMLGDRPLATIGRAVGRIFLGGQTPGDTSGTGALPGVPQLIAAYSKVITTFVGIALIWLDLRFGWNLSGSLGEEFEVIILGLLTLYFQWRVPHRTKD